MIEKTTFEGRSFFFNILFVLVNLAGLTFLVLGFHENFADQSAMYITIAMVAMIMSIGGLIIFKGRYMMASLSRVLVGGLFIVSGLVKANDPLGFSYKLKEYFEDGALAYRIKEWFSVPSFSMEFLMDYALLLSVVICIVEIVLGVLVIIGGKIKLVSYLTLLMMLFFTFLTWHTSTCDPNAKFVDRDAYGLNEEIASVKMSEAKTNKDIKILASVNGVLIVDELKSPQCVKDCGCFGDAMKGSVGRSLTPNESLWKDIVLLYFVIWIFITQGKIQPNNRKENMIYLVTSLVVISFFSWVFGWYFPILFGFVSVVGALWMIRAGGKFLGNHYGSILIVTAFGVILTSYVLMYLPLKDYRPYSVGSNLKEKMNDGIEGKYEYYYELTNNETKKTDTVEMSKIPVDVWGDAKKWTAKLIETREVISPRNASIMDFYPSIQMDEIGDQEKSLNFINEKLKSLMTRVYKIYSIEYKSYMDTPEEEYDPEFFPESEYRIEDTLYMINPEVSDLNIVDDILESNKMVILVSQKLDEANWQSIASIKKIQKLCLESNIPFIMISNYESRKSVDEFRKAYNLQIPVFAMDGIELKVICRSNPALIVIEKGVVKAKYPHRSIPSVEIFKNEIIKK